MDFSPGCLTADRLQTEPLKAQLLTRYFSYCLESKEIKPVSLKGNQPWMCTGRTDAEAEAPILWPSDAKSRLTGKDPNAGKDWGQEKKGVTEDEMVGWHYRFNGHEFEQTPGESETGKPGLLQSMGSQRVRQDLRTEQQPQLGRGIRCLYQWGKREKLAWGRQAWCLYTVLVSQRALRTCLPQMLLVLCVTLGNCLTSSMSVSFSAK